MKWDFRLAKNTQDSQQPFQTPRHGGSTKSSLGLQLPDRVREIRRHCPFSSGEHFDVVSAKLRSTWPPAKANSNRRCQVSCRALSSSPGGRDTQETCLVKVGRDRESVFRRADQTSSIKEKNHDTHEPFRGINDALIRMGQPLTLPTLDVRHARMKMRNSHASCSSGVKKF